jgi:Uri superfamily endonuclease
MTRNPPRRGVYGLVLRVTRETKVEVGRLGSVEFRPGIYVYIGSALSSLQARIRRHYSQAKKRHWHIDYLTSRSEVKLLGHAVRQTSRPIECSVSRAVKENSTTSVHRFGSSDCDCDSHLHFFSTLRDAKPVLLRQGLQLCLRRLQD